MKDTHYRQVTAAAAALCALMTNSAHPFSGTGRLRLCQAAVEISSGELGTSASCFGERRRSLSPRVPVQLLWRSNPATMLFSSAHCIPLTGHPGHPRPGRTETRYYTGNAARDKSGEPSSTGNSDSISFALQDAAGKAAACPGRKRVPACRRAACSCCCRHALLLCDVQPRPRLPAGPLRGV